MKIKSLQLLSILLLLVSVTALGQEERMPTMSETEITIPWEDFKRIMEELIVKPPPPPVLPPVDVSIKRAIYDITISPGFLEVDLTYQVMTYGEDWHEVFVSGDTTSLNSLYVNGGDAPTLIRDDSVYVLIKGQGKNTINATFYVNAPETPGPHTVSFPVPDTPTSLIRLDYDTALSEVGVNGIMISKLEGSLIALLKSGERAEIRYTVAALKEEEGVEGTEPIEEIEPQVLAEVMSVLDVEEEALFVESLINFEVRNSPVTSLSLTLPRGFELVDVIGDGLAGWEVAKDGKGLEVTLGYEIEGIYSLKLLMEGDFTPGEKVEGSNGGEESGGIEGGGAISIVEFPVIVPLETKRTMGYIAVVSGGGFEITESEATGLRPQDPSELPFELLSLKDLPPILSYKYTQSDWGLSLKVKSSEILPTLDAFVDSANSVAVVTADGKMVMRTFYYIRNKNRQYLKLTVPEGGEFWSAAVSGSPAKTSIDEDGRILIPLPLGIHETMEPFVVETVTYTPVEECGLMGAIRLPLPSLDIPAAEMMVTFYLPERNSYLKFGGDMDKIEYFEVLLAPDASESFVEDNIKLRKEVYMRQNELEMDIEEKQNLNLDDTIAPAPRFELPLRGEIHRFVKLIVISEETEVEAVYVDSRLFTSIVVFLVLGFSAVVFFVVKKLFLKKRV